MILRRPDSAQPPRSLREPQRGRPCPALTQPAGALEGAAVPSPHAACRSPGERGRPRCEHGEVGTGGGCWWCRARRCWGASAPAVTCRSVSRRTWSDPLPKAQARFPSLMACKRRFPPVHLASQVPVVSRGHARPGAPLPESGSLHVAASPLRPRHSPCRCPLHPPGRHFLVPPPRPPQS